MAAGTVPQVGTSHLFRMSLTTLPPQTIGATPAGQRRIIPLTGGTFEGERLRGVVTAGGSDWQTLATDGSVGLDVRLVLQTDDGALIGYRYRGIRAGTPDVLARIDRGELVDPSQYYMRTTGMFETASAAYGWLNRIVAVAIGSRLASGPVYDVYEVL
jgi:Protein of unknown function (DUF3237)